MTYRVTFHKRFQEDGEPSGIEPERFVVVSDGVILDAAMAEQDEPPAKHSQDALDEDDNFESVGTEVWEYQIADGGEREFVDALKNSQMVLDYQKIDELA
ncbi:MAG TPA: hypothetical protein VMZ52_11305 [Bryobacteraceae bacterium]|nr:hypothetical protein [Bryobacteraceae bacterium]